VLLVTLLETLLCIDGRYTAWLTRTEYSEVLAEVEYKYGRAAMLSLQAYGGFFGDRGYVCIGLRRDEEIDAALGVLP
jgi:hypothetical protein